MFNSIGLVFLREMTSSWEVGTLEIILRYLFFIFSVLFFMKVGHKRVSVFPSPDRAPVNRKIPDPPMTLLLSQKLSFGSVIWPKFNKLVQI